MRAIVTVGLPACGKSTFAGTLEGEYVELNLDTLRFELSGDAGNQHVTHRAIGRRKRRLAELAARGQNVILSDTHARRRDRRRTIRELQALGYEVELRFFNVGERTCQARNQAREHPVPPEVLSRMARRLRETPPTPDEADRFTVATEPDDPLLADLEGPSPAS